MITYKETQGKIKVFVSGKLTGEIVKGEKGFRYKVARANVYGEWFPTIGKVKLSLEEM